MEYRKEYGNPADMPEDAVLRQALADMGTCPCSGNGQSSRSGQSCPVCPGKSRSSRQEMGSCVAGTGVDPLAGFPLAMAYVPNQPWEGIQEPEAALASGTLFTGLLFPWRPSRCSGNKGCSCGRD